MRSLPTLLKTGLVIGVLCLAGYLAVTLYRIETHRNASNRMDVAILRLSEHRPPGLTEDQWAYCVLWTWNLHSNYGHFPRVPKDELGRLERELHARIDRGPDLATIDWLWDEYTQYGGARNYDHFRPTAAHNRADFDAGAHGGNSLAEWQARYRERSND